ncbi:SigE family RNA polymerase sigma factor [Saccharothrix australiensis]|uniref:RNA polymerase sigma-70 factor (Sigma-E family) n=1 Tax=Saccharothrix australiensis TaxID=2072 RepID=A0A495VUL0_9PSEU|nr:SigE family RNA polymerase sigma factor [Saccharothrix australiensis]RKT52864.1 RNA polymerase sigma-70 factor (sigma-E family) [Saccharothrix australiensis]
MTDDEFQRYAATSTATIRRAAYRLCGDRHAADDLTQTTLAKMFTAWPRLGPGVNLDAYARKVLLRTAIDEGQRSFRRRETAVGELPPVAAPPPGVEDVLDVRAALVRLPPGQREVVVLRYCADLSVAETARRLGCAEGTVKSQAAKGLAALRGLLAVRSRPAAA